MNVKKSSIVLGIIVYLGVVIVATVLTFVFVTGWMEAPESMADYIIRTLLGFGIVMVAINSIAMPLAIHGWAVSGPHRTIAMICYGLDMTVLTINMITSFSTLMGNPPQWVSYYEPYSVAMFIIPLASWGVLFITDPVEHGKLQMKKAEQAYEVNVAKYYQEYVDSAEGQNDARAAALLLAREEIARKANEQRVLPYGAPKNSIQVNYQASVNLPAQGPTEKN